MSIQITIHHNIDPMAGLLAEVKRSVPKSTRRAIGRAITAGQKETVSIIKEKYRINKSTFPDKQPASFLKKRLTRAVKRTAGMDASKHHGEIEIRDNPLSKVRFVRGRKTPAKQRGVKVARRKRVVVEVQKGVRSSLRHAFIAKTKNGPMLFTRATSKSNPIRKVVTQSPHQLFRKHKYEKRVKDTMRFKMEQEFKRSMAYFESQAIYRANAARLKKEGR